MPRTISDEEYNHLIGRAQLADFVEPIYNNPKTSRKAKALIKEAYPTLEIPGYDTEQTVAQQFAERDQRDAEKARKAKEDEEDRQWREQRDKVKAARKFSDEDMTKVEKLMLDRRIGNYEDAAEIYTARLPKPSTPTYDNHWNHQAQPEAAEIGKDPEGYMRREFLAAIQRDQEALKGGR